MNHDSKENKQDSSLEEQIILSLKDSRSYIENLKQEIGGNDPEHQRARILSAFRETFTGPAGRIVLGVLAASAGHGRPAFIRGEGGTIDPYAAAHRDGRKSIIDEILEQLSQHEEQPPRKPAAKR